MSVGLIGIKLMKKSLGTLYFIQMEKIYLKESALIHFLQEISTVNLGWNN
jgi:hypothetical protein